MRNGLATYFARFGLLAALAVALAACGKPKPDFPELSPEELAELQDQILPTSRVRVEGVDYAVSPRQGQDGTYLIRTIGGQAGTRSGVYAALRRIYGCQQANLTEIIEPWVRTEARAAFCTKSPSQ